MLRLYKGYLILSLAGVIKKLTQQYIGPFQIKERIGCLAYRLKILSDWQIYPVFLVAQLEPAFKPFINPFWQPHLHHSSTVFVDNDTDSLKSFEINRLLKKQTIKRGKDLTIKNFVCWTSYCPKWYNWYNVKDLNNAGKLICKHEKGFA